MYPFRWALFWDNRCVWYTELSGVTVCRADSMKSIDFHTRVHKEATMNYECPDER